MSSPILVTGGAGFIGSALVKRLLELGNSVRVFDDLSRGRPNRLAEFAGDDRLEIQRGDIRDREAVRQAVAGCDLIWHLAYVGAPQNLLHNPALMWDIGVKGIVNLLDACTDPEQAAHGPSKELFVISTSEVYSPQAEVPTPETVPLWVADVGSPRASYGGGKIISELGAMAYAMSGLLKRVVIIRPHSVYGPDAGGDHVIPQFIARMKAELAGEQLWAGFGSNALLHGPRPALEFPIQGSGEETRSFIYIEDLIEAFVVLLAKGEDRHVYHVGSEESVSMSELARLIGAWFGRQIQVLPGQVAAAGQAPRRRPDISKMRALGWEPRVTLRDGLEPTVRWYVAHG